MVAAAAAEALGAASSGARVTDLNTRRARWQRTTKAGPVNHLARRRLGYPVLSSR